MYLILKPWYSVLWSSKDRELGLQTEPLHPLKWNWIISSYRVVEALFGGLALCPWSFKELNTRALKWGTNILPTPSGSGCTDQNVNQEIGGYPPFFLGLYLGFALFILDQTCPNWIKLVQNGPHVSKMDPLVQNKSNLHCITLHCLALLSIT